MGPLIARSHQLWRFYGVGVVNTAFGYGVFSGLVWMHLNVFAAQLLGYPICMVFNYLMFRRLVFTDAPPAILRYIGSYVVNYALSLGALATIRLVVPSPYLAGFLAIVCVSVINYFILKRFVFRPKSTAA